MTIEQGKPINEARGEIGYGASLLNGFLRKQKEFMGTLSQIHWLIEYWL